MTDTMIRKRLHDWGRRVIVSSIALSGAASLAAQDAMEYFWNTDPGVGKATAMPLTAPGADGRMSFDLTAEGLHVGTNVLGCRTFSGGHWSHTVYNFVFMDGGEEGTWRAEYFWDEDPGYGGGTPLKLEGGVGEQMTFDIDTSALPTGMHLLGVRAATGAGWTQTATYIILIPRDDEMVSNAEYFWDTDPGYGQAMPLGIGNGMIDAEILAEGLTPGIHILGVRACTSGLWSQTVTSIIVVPMEDADLYTTAEYFWDEDPGYGKGTLMKTQGGQVDEEISTEGLTPGNHVFGVRACTAGIWSQTIWQDVMVSTGKELSMTAEYFWGDDPGYGNGTPIEMPQGASVEIPELTLDFPKETAETYVLSVRARTDAGWGPTMVREIPHLYVEQIEIAADTTVMARGAEMQLTAVFTPEEPFVNTVKWDTSDAKIATVDQSGLVKALAEGEVTISATSEDGTDVTGTIDLSVIVPVQKIEISPAALTLAVTETGQLKAVLTPADATVTDVTWSAEGDCVSVDEDGTVYALKRGTATVTATAADGTGVTGACTVTIGYLMGDADDDSRLAVNDVVLAARAVVGDIADNVVIPAIDFNADSDVTVGDLTQTAAAVIEWEQPDWWGRPMGHIFRENVARPSEASLDDLPYAGEIMIEASGNVLTLDIEGRGRWSGLQFDVLTPDGVTVGSVVYGHDAAPAHTTALHRFDDTAARSMAYAAQPFASAGTHLAAITLDADASLTGTTQTVVLANIMASDLKGTLHQLGSIEVATEIGATGAETIDASALTITVRGHEVTIVSPAKCTLTLTDMLGISRKVDVEQGENRLTIDSDGVYVLGGKKIIIQ